MHQDRNLLAQAEILRLIDDVRADFARSQPVAFVMHLDHLRHRADQHGFGALGLLCSALESAFASDRSPAAVTTLLAVYGPALADAGRLPGSDAATGRQLLASVASRLHG